MQTQDPVFQLKRSRTKFLLFDQIGSDPVALKILASEIRSAGYAVQCPQLKDHGAPRNVPAENTWQIWYRSCERALADITGDCDRVIVGGLGLGSLLGLCLAAEHPDKVQGVAALSPTLWFEVLLLQKLLAAFRIGSSTSISTNFGPSFVRASGNRALANKDNSQLNCMSASLATEHRRLAMEVMKKLKRVHQPTFIIQPRTDNRADLRSAEYLQRHLGGPVQVTILDSEQPNGTVDGLLNVIAEKFLAFAADVERSPGSAEILQFPPESSNISYPSSSNGTRRGGGVHARQVLRDEKSDEIRVTLLRF